MACLEHACRECDALWFSNRDGGACPKCGSFDFSTHFDEPMGDYDDDYGDDNPHDLEDV